MRDSESVQIHYAKKFSCEVSLLLCMMRNALLLFIAVLLTTVIQCYGVSYYHLGPAYYCKSKITSKWTESSLVCEGVMKKLEEVLKGEKGKQIREVTKAVTDVCVNSGWATPISEGVLKIIIRTLINR